mgnify:CR=1 FL=1|tara:strand:+ start:541 stop:717 length:177 start_codon:yes stop_codon:yes gene_type:complete
MKVFRTPNFKRRFTDPLKPKRILSHRFGFKMPKGGGVLRNPYKAIYNRVYNYVAKKLF